MQCTVGRWKCFFSLKLIWFHLWHYEIEKNRFILIILAILRGESWQLIIYEKRVFWCKFKALVPQGAWWPYLDLANKFNFALVDNCLYMYRVIKINLLLCFIGVPCKDIPKKIIWRFPLYEYTLFSFYKQNSIFKSKGSFCGNKFLKRRIKGFNEFPFENMNKEIIWCC